MSKKKDSMLEQVGVTPDGKKLVAGVYRFYETEGLPLDVIFECISRKDAVISWPHFYNEAITAGMKHDRILSKLEEAICDVYGKPFYDIVEHKLNEMFGKKETKMCQIRDDMQEIKPDKVFMIGPDVSFICMHCGAKKGDPCDTKIFKHERLKPRGLKSKDKTVTVLYRPVGGLEHHLIRQTQNKKFPPRLAHQPIFYPVCNEQYAIQIARDWNAKDKENGGVGIVVQFKVTTEFLKKYEIHTVGGLEHQEYWIPAEHLDEFNKHIVGEIETIHVFQGTP